MREDEYSSPVIKEKTPLGEFTTPEGKVQGPFEGMNDVGFALHIAEYMKGNTGCETGTGFTGNQVNGPSPPKMGGSPEYGPAWAYQVEPKHSRTTGANPVPGKVGA